MCWWTIVEREAEHESAAELLAVAEEVMGFGFSVPAPRSREDDALHRLARLSRSSW